MRNLALIIILLIVAAQARANEDFMACPEVQSDRLLGVSHGDMPSATVDWVGIDKAVSGQFRGRIVDVRPADVQRRAPLPGVVQLDLLQLRTLAGRVDERIAVVGTGFDDDRLARRIAGWPELNGRLQIVSGGAAAWLSAAHEQYGKDEIEAALGVPAKHALAAVQRSGLELVSLGTASHAMLEQSLPGVRTRQVNDARAIAALVESPADAGIDRLVLVCMDGRRSAEIAVQLSHQLERPVFYIQNGAEALAAYSRQFADINRRPGLIRGSCQ